MILETLSSEVEWVNPVTPGGARRADPGRRHQHRRSTSPGRPPTSGGLLVRRGTAATRQPGRWDDRLVAFEAGYLGWALWTVVSEYLLKVNWDR
jgi:hypothetical protein